MAAGGEGFDVFDLCKSLVTWILVVLGWMVVSDQQEQRETRKDALARISDFREQVRELEKDVRAHHMSDWDGDRVRQLQRRFHTLGQEATLLKKMGCFEPKWIEVVRDFKVQSLLKNCDKSSHKVLPADDLLVVEIGDASALVDSWAISAMSNKIMERRPLVVSVWASLRRIV